ncbi:bifunctional nicotinamidase/pyrazinamidase [Roseospira marina]|uniref:Nicotinamidase n=2 Tax=Roseospira marina TaxID=140057 RepID=A0A5M6IET5_9PROT|nr:bifunctional nicotinamidase/pyrazinamidase [Roseospira marina]KAA5606790.1 bifunctional nicotinamidase/pyrazinamidase [Roseospira marina]MBB4313788.1 nicotinamidase/pyrazinamidase [Roseospira marina]
MRDDTAFVIVDVQTDFCPGGALAVADGDAVVPVINRLAPLFRTVILTQDWHPAGHASFATSHAGAAPFSTIAMPYGPQVLWPDHCVQGTPGAGFHPGLETDRARFVVRKGTDPAIDSYSAFFENDHTTPTGLAGALSDLGIRHVVMAGLATDFCVRWSAVDGRRVGLAVTLVEDACRAIDLDGSLDAALREMHAAGVTLTDSTALAASGAA